jgi:hypothetical protein
MYSISRRDSFASRARWISKISSGASCVPARASMRVANVAIAVFNLLAESRSWVLAG